ncbi:MAG: pyruvate kinase [Candidatus Marsarchaeota archaeon]|nr:pyruvate kinase [Candidatus Marsarchaeota archaeon]MCL5095055.1 pyruvate kinase [Candidatus Marsarchaeota archaeon]
MIKTKVIVTNGPSLKFNSVLKNVIRYSDIIRFNFSHAKEEEIINTISRIEKISEEIKKDVAILGDLSGPKIRIKRLSNNFNNVKKGDIVDICFNKKEDNIKEDSEKTIYLDYNLFDNIKKNNIIFYGDGELKFLVLDKYNGKVIIKALNDHTVKIEKGISVFGSEVNLEPPTKNDLKFLKFAVKNDFDFIAVSFVKSDKNIKQIKKITGDIEIISKIETKEAIDNIDGIIRESDGIMVARGDLGLHVGIAKLPITQQYLIKKCQEYQKPVIVATQLLSSMINSSFPTRAEANDIANNIFDRVDCVMLSNETAVGKYPVETLQTLNEIIENTEKFIESEENSNRINKINTKINKINQAISFAAVGLAHNFKTDCIFAPTQTGATAKILSSLKPYSNIIALTNSKKIRNKLAILYGVRAFPIEKYNSINEMINNVKKVAIQNKINKFIIVSGTPNKFGTTDTLKYIDLKS